MFWKYKNKSKYLNLIPVFVSEYGKHRSQPNVIADKIVTVLAPNSSAPIKTISSGMLLKDETNISKVTVDTLSLFSPAVVVQLVLSCDVLDKMIKKCCKREKIINIQTT